MVLLASGLECAVIKNRPATSLDSALAKLLDLKSFGIRTYKKIGVRPLVPPHVAPTPCCYTRAPLMPARFCEVALAVPLRSTFTYAVPASLAELVAPGSRVVVPFRSRAMVGIVLELADRAPEAMKIREVTDVLDPIPALTPRLIELGRWVAQYYLAPLGDVLRAMLPPVVELRQEREFLLTTAGREYLAELASRGNRSEAEITELALLQLFEVEGKPFRGDRLRKLPGGDAAAARLLRRGQIEAREVTRRRKTRMQKIVAWNPEASVETGARTAAVERIRRVLEEDRGPLPVRVLLAQAGVSPAVVARLVRQGKLKMWEEPAAAE